jgi:hypothetical protein
MGEIDSLIQVLQHTRRFRELFANKSGRDLDRRLTAQENALYVAPFAAPLPIQQSFSLLGQFAFGMPGGFGPPSPQVLHQWEQGFDSRPLVAIVDQNSAIFSFFLAVFSGPSEHAINPADLGGHSLWILEILGEAYRERARQVGRGLVVAGPKALLVGGERAIWTVLEQVENGVQTRKWSTLIVSAGRVYSIMMFVRTEAESTYSGAYWTAVGSWQWLTEQHAGGPPPLIAPPLPPPV